MPFVGNIANKIGPRYSYNLSFHFVLQGNFYRFSILIGSGLYSFGYIMTYLSVQSYFALAVLTLSLHGLAFGFVYATAIKSAQVCPTFYIQTSLLSFWYFRAGFLLLEKVWWHQQQWQDMVLAQVFGLQFKPFMLILKILNLQLQMIHVEQTTTNISQMKVSMIWNKIYDSYMADFPQMFWTEYLACLSCWALSMQSWASQLHSPSQNAVSRPNVPDLVLPVS